MNTSSVALETRHADIQRFFSRLRSNLDRSVYRTLRASTWRLYHEGRRPRTDTEIAIAWAVRKLNGQGFVIRRPSWTYRPDPYGPDASQGVILEVLIPTTEYELDYFSTIKELPASIGYTLAYIEPLADLTAWWSE